MSTFVDFEIDVNDIETSVRDWEVFEARVRLSVEKTYEGTYKYNYSYIVRARRTFSSSLDSDDFLDLDGLIMIVKGPTGCDHVFRLDSFEGPNWIDKGCILEYDKLVPLESIKFSITAVDSSSGQHSAYRLHIPVRTVPIRFVSQFTKDWLSVKFDTAAASIGTGLWDRQIDCLLMGHLDIDARKLNSSGEYQEFSADYLESDGIMGAIDWVPSLSTLSASVEIVDQSGFPLESVDFSFPAIKFPNRRLERNYLTWSFSEFFDLDEMMGMPAEVVVRIRDED